MVGIHGRVWITLSVHSTHATIKFHGKVTRTASANKRKVWGAFVFWSTGSEFAHVCFQSMLESLCQFVCKILQVCYILIALYSLPDSHVSYWSTELSDSTWPFHAHRQHLIQKTSAVRAQGNLRRRHFPWARTRGVESSKHSIQKHLASWMSAIALWRYQNVAQLFKNRYCTTNTAIHTSSSKAKVPWAQYGYDRLCLEG